MTSAKSETLLPTDVAQCHALIYQMKEQFQQQELCHKEEKKHLNERLSQLTDRVQYLLNKLYGRSSEKIDPNQLYLFGEHTESIAQQVQEELVVVPDDTPSPKKKGHGRKKLPEELPRLPIEYDVPEADKLCADCGATKTRIGEERSEQLEYAPASLFVIEHIRPKYACPCCEGNIVIADKPAQPIEKGLAAPGLLSHVIVSKYCDHLPLYRQEAIFERYGIDLSRKTMCGWVMASAEQLRPMVDAMRQDMLQSKVIHTDDTPVDVQIPGGGMCTGRFWVYAGDGEHPYTLYDFTPSRRRDGPMDYLDRFKGTTKSPRYLQADAFGGYNVLYESGNHIREVACWAHARRKFHEARSNAPTLANAMMARIGQLYAIERDAKELTSGQRCDLRQEKAIPILNEIRAWLDEQQEKVLPKPDIGKAIVYALNQWEALVRYTEDGDLDIDNNTAENALRGIAIGRKNWLFTGSDRGGRTAAILYSCITSAKRHGLDPFVYIRDVLYRIPTHLNKDIHQLFPDNWKKIFAKEAATPPYAMK